MFWFELAGVFEVTDITPCAAANIVFKFSDKNHYPKILKGLYLDLILSHCLEKIF